MPRRLRHSSRLPLIVVACLLSLTLATCSNPTDDSANVLPSSKGATDGGGDSGCGQCDCLKVGTWYRFKELVLTSIDGYKDHAITQVLNPFWQTDIDNDELNFFMEVQKVSATEVTMRVVNGARVANGEDVCLLPYTAVEVIHPRQGCCLGASKPTGMNVYAGTDANPKNCAPYLPVKHAIPVRNAILDTKVIPDAVDGCTEVTGTLISGALGIAALKETCTCLNPNKPAEACETLSANFDDGKDPGCGGCSSKYQNLWSLLTKFKPALTFSCQTPDGEPAACLSARFSGVKIDAPPPDCK